MLSSTKNQRTVLKVDVVPFSKLFYQIRDLIEIHGITLLIMILGVGEVVCHITVMVRSKTRRDSIVTT